MTTPEVIERPVERRRPYSARRTRGIVGPAVDRRVGGLLDQLTAEEVLERIDAMPWWSRIPRRRLVDRRRGASLILGWLAQHSGDGWHQRWLRAGADRGRQWLEDLVANDSRTDHTKHTAITLGLADLALCRVVLPGYPFLHGYRAGGLLEWVRQAHRPDLFAQATAAGADAGMSPRQTHQAISVLTKVVLHTGRDLNELAGDDLHDYREWFYQGLSGHKSGTHAAWQLLQSIGVLAGQEPMITSSRLGQQSPAELVDSYRIRCRPIRDVLVRYLTERAAALDYRTLCSLATGLVGRFWADIERHHPELEPDYHSIALPDAVVDAWKQRLRTVTTPNGETQPRRSHLAILNQVRSFYLDIQQWALEDPSWTAWAVPSPVRRNELLGMQKQRKKTISEMHQRVRERLPHLARLADSANSYRIEQAALLAAARSTPLGETFHHGGVTYRHTLARAYLKNPNLPRPHRVLIENTASGESLDVRETEDHAFWAWAVIETLRHTGVRIEELLEITHLAVIAYQLPGTTEIVPMLQIVPSKANEERLLLISPELASVLASIIKRLRDDNDGVIPLIARYDYHERVTGPPLPHLFQRKATAWRSAVMSPSLIRRLLDDALARTGLADLTGTPLRYTPHDFRRIFATDAVTGGLPVHIVARLLGHKNINTTQAYMAVFDEELVRSYRAFLDQRRAHRPEAEFREPTDEEWREFQQHFQLRRLELGECGRPYGAPCKHEHACIRCPSLRLDPSARPRLAGIVANLNDRIKEAELNGWAGEVQGLQVSLNAAINKLTSLDRLRTSQPAGPVNLGIPIITESR